MAPSTIDGEHAQRTADDGLGNTQVIFSVCQIDVCLGFFIHQSHRSLVTKPKAWTRLNG